VAGAHEINDDRRVIVLGVLAALLALGVLYQTLGARRDRRQYPAPGSFIDVRGHRVHAHCRGEGSPLVVLEAGIAGSSLSWTVVQPRIATFTRACAYDRAGLAWSEAPPRDRSVNTILNELSDVLAAVGDRDRVVIVGHSFGSLIARTWAARHPERVAGIVLVDPPTEWLSLTPERAYRLRRGRVLSNVGAWLAHVGVVRACLDLVMRGAGAAPRRFVTVFGPLAARTLERFVGEVRKLPADVHPIVKAIWCQPKCFHAMAGYLQTLEREGALLTEVPPPDVPVVVVSGGDQTAEGIAAHRALAELSTQGRHVVAYRSAHWVQFDEPELIVSEVRALVESGRRYTSPLPT
jgi:pimeloyl-ACP methyl ester carboxylesterase